MSMSVHCSVLEVHFGIALNNGLLHGKEHMLTPCPALHRHFCAWVGTIRLDSGKDRGGHSWSVDCTVSWTILKSCHSTSAYLVLNVLGADWTVAPPVCSFPRFITWYICIQGTCCFCFQGTERNLNIHVCKSPLRFSRFSIVRFTRASYWPAVPDVSHLEEYCLQGCDAG